MDHNSNDPSFATTLTKAIKTNIDTFIKRSLEGNIKEEEVQENLIQLYKELLIPSDLYEWCIERVKKISNQIQSVFLDLNDSDETNQVENLPPLFSKENVYHASLCSYVVSTYSGTDQEDILSTEGHKFESMSISLLSDHRIFVAEKDKIVFIAFKGECHIDKWLEYASPEEGTNIDFTNLTCLMCRFTVSTFKYIPINLFTGNTS